MHNTSVSQILTQLGTGNFTPFIGQKENDYFEAKGAIPYDLNSPQGRYEIAKDVSAFANASGGLIIIGLTHKKLDSENTDEVTGTELLAEGDLPINQMLGVLKSHIWPIIAGLEVKWFPSSGASDQGLGCIHIPAQNDDKKFFLITKVVEEGQPLKEIVFGIARRVRADNIPLTPSELHRHIGEGRNSIAQRLSRIEDKLDGLMPQQKPPSIAAAQALNYRLSDLLKGS